MNLNSHDNPYLSVVAVSRNDDHGGDPLVRTQHFVDCFAQQCAHFGLAAEIVLVDWNPPENRCSLAEALNWSVAEGKVEVRVFTVLPEIHQTLQFAESLPLYQMIGKNVGIRRARGEFVLATNIDILFSDELIEWLVGRPLRPNRLYRCDRIDIANEVPTSGDRVSRMEYAWNNVIRVNGKNQTFHLRQELDSSGPVMDKVVRDAPVREEDCPADLKPATNACGDFTLLHRKAWWALRGYPEFDTFSLHIDSILLYQAHYGGFRQIYLSQPAACFHIEHSLGSGWTPLGKKVLYERLDNKNIDYFDSGLLSYVAKQIKYSNELVLMNSEHWGLQWYEASEVNPACKI